MKTALKLLAKCILIPSGLIARVSATDAAIPNKMFGAGSCPSDLAREMTLMISTEEMNDIMKKAKPQEESDLLIKWVSETIENEAKEQKGQFLGMLSGVFVASLLGNLLTDKGTIRAGEGTVRAGQDFNATSSFNNFWNTNVLSQWT